MRPSEVKLFPENLMNPFEEQSPSTMLYGLIALQARSLSKNGAAFLLYGAGRLLFLAPAGGNDGTSGSMGVPRKTTEALPGTIPINDAVLRSPKV